MTPFLQNNTRQHARFNDANDRSNCQLFESPIGLGKYVFLQKLHGYSVLDPDWPGGPGWPGPEPDIHASLAKF